MSKYNLLAHNWKYIEFDNKEQFMNFFRHSNTSFDDVVEIKSRYGDKDAHEYILAKYIIHIFFDRISNDRYAYPRLIPIRYVGSSGDYYDYFEQDAEITLDQLGKAFLAMSKNAKVENNYED